MLDEGDYVISAKMCFEEDDLMLISRKGFFVRFNNGRVRSQGRVTRGVRGIRLRDDDYVVSMEVVDQEKTLLVAGTDGIGKRSPYDEYRETNRGGLGSRAIKSDEVAGALSIAEDDEIMLLTQRGQAVRDSS